MNSNRQEGVPENSQLLFNRKSCPDRKLTNLAEGSKKKPENQENEGFSKSRSNSNAFKGDRFIPFRGTQDNFMEEYIMNFESSTRDQKTKQKQNNENEFNPPSTQ